MASTSYHDFDFSSTMEFPGDYMPTTFNDMLGGNTSSIGRTAANHSPNQDVGGNYLQGPAGEMGWPTGSVVDSPSKDYLASENAALKTRLAAFETPKKPRKRNSSRTFSGEGSPPERPGQGPIEGMWGAGASHDQRTIFAQASSPAATTPSSTKKRKITKKEATPKKTPVKKWAVKPNKGSLEATFPETFNSVNGQIGLTPQARAKPVRDASELMNLPWDTLSHIERATLLLPMLQGIAPETGEQVDAPGSLAQAMHMDQEERSYIEEVADPAFFNHAHDFNNVKGAQEEDSYTQDPAAQALFADYEDSDNVATAEQDASSNQYIDENSYDIATPSPDSTIRLPSDYYFAEAQPDAYLPSDELVDEPNFEQDDFVPLPSDSLYVPRQTAYIPSAEPTVEQDNSVPLPSDSVYVPRQIPYIPTVEPAAELTHGQDVSARSPSSYASRESQVDDHLSSTEANAEHVDLINGSMTMSQEDINNAQLLSEFSNSSNQPAANFFDDFINAQQNPTDAFNGFAPANQLSFEDFFNSNSTASDNSLNGTNPFSSDSFLSGIDLTSSNDFLNGINLDGLSCDITGNATDLTTLENLTDFTALDNLNDLTALDDFTDLTAPNAFFDLSQFTTSAVAMNVNADWDAGVERQRKALEKHARTGGCRR